MKAILGLKLDPWHDTGAAIVLDDGSRLRVVAISQERLDRVKHSRAFPAEAISYCLAEVGCQLKDLGLIVADFILKPTADDLFPGDGRAPSAAKLNFFREIRDLGIPVIFAEHHLCHAASAFYATDWDDAATLVIDGHGSYYETQSIFSCRAGGITKLATSHRPGIGWMYSAVTERLLGFDHLQDGKTMGLAGVGEKWLALERVLPWETRTEQSLRNRIRSIRRRGTNLEADSTGEPDWQAVDGRPRGRAVCAICLRRTGRTGICGDGIGASHGQNGPEQAVVLFGGRRPEHPRESVDSGLGAFRGSLHPTSRFRRRAFRWARRYWDITAYSVGSAAGRWTTLSSGASTNPKKSHRH